MKTETTNKEIKLYICENCNTSTEYEGDIFICQQCSKEKCNTCSTKEWVDRNTIDPNSEYSERYRIICGECESKNREVEITHEMLGYIYQVNNYLYRHPEKFSDEELKQKVEYSLKHKHDFHDDSWESTFEYQFGFEMLLPDVSIKIDLV